jgi:uncharacterized SAM-binding protein YcdF (DUF218 family)
MVHLPEHLDGLIILGARVNLEGEPGRVARLRLRHGLNLWWHHYSGKYLLLTGGRRPGTPVTEARAMADWSLEWTAQNWGEAARDQLHQCLILEEESLNTHASARHTLALVAGRGSRTVGLVSDSLHMRRAHFLFRRHFGPWGIAVSPLPAPGLVKHYWERRRYLWLTKMALREGGAWVKVLGGLVFREQR